MNELIVGAGPTGLTAAVELALLRVVARVIDLRRKPSGLSRAVAVSPANLRLFDHSGVSASLISSGIRLQQVVFYETTRKLMELNLGVADRTRSFLLALTRSPFPSVRPPHKAAETSTLLATLLNCHSPVVDAA